MFSGVPSMYMPHAQVRELIKNSTSKAVHAGLSKAGTGATTAPDDAAAAPAHGLDSATAAAAADAGA